MIVSIFGMGYVGIVSAACLLRDGHTVVGVDVVEAKVKDLAAGLTPVKEPGVAELLAQGRRDNRLFASTKVPDGVKDAEMVWICVGTPSEPDGGINLKYVMAVVEQIGRALTETPNRPLIVLRSTVLPGTTAKLVIPALEKASGLKVGSDIQVVFHPEFLREATAVYDFDNPPKIVAGEQTPGAAAPLWRIYEKYEFPKFTLKLTEAEMVKYYDNLFHALKITFANEMGAVAHKAGVDARRVADVFLADTKLNISPYYLRPGFAFGGSCLPKDLRAMLRYATVNSVDIPMLTGVLESNQRQIEALVRRVLAHQPRQGGLIGLAFKRDTDDMRESPYVAIAKRLIGEGVQVKIYDPYIQTEELIGSNKQAVEQALGHLRDWMIDRFEELDECNLLLINHAAVEAPQVEKWLAKKIRILDLAGIRDVASPQEFYEGISW